MRITRLILRELLYRKLGFALGTLSVAGAVGLLVVQLAFLRLHDRRTEQVLQEKRAQLRQDLAALEDDYRRITLGMGFNLLILPKGQNLADFYAEDFAQKTMPETWATKLAEARVMTVNHILPSLQRKVKWEEQQVLLSGVRGEVYIQSGKQKPLLEAVAPGTMVVGYELHRRLKLAVGQEVKLLGRSFKVAKLHPERGAKDDITIWIHLKEAQELLGLPAEINAILALQCACDKNRLAKIREEIGRILPETQVIEFAGQALARAETRNRAAEESKRALEREQAQRHALRQERVALAAVLTPAAAGVCAVLVALLTWENVRQRRGEIGILRALGVGSGKVLALFLGKALAMGVAGALVGWGGGWLVGWWRCQAALPAGADASGLPLVPGWLFPAALAAAPLVAMAAAWLPALWATQQDPAVVLQD